MLCFINSGTSLATFLALILYRRAVQNKERASRPVQELGGAGRPGLEAAFASCVTHSMNIWAVQAWALLPLAGEVPNALGTHAMPGLTRPFPPSTLAHPAVTMDDVEARLRSRSTQLSNIAEPPAAPLGGSPTSRGLPTSRSAGAAGGGSGAWSLA